MAKKDPVDEQNIDGYGAPTIPWGRARERFEARISRSMRTVSSPSPVQDLIWSSKVKPRR